jgi:hypothetical protein
MLDSRQFLVAFNMDALATLNLTKMYISKTLFALYDNERYPRHCGNGKLWIRKLDEADRTGL